MSELANTMAERTQYESVISRLTRERDDAVKRAEEAEQECERLKIYRFSDDELEELWESGRTLAYCDFVMLVLTKRDEKEEMKLEREDEK